MRLLCSVNWEKKIFKVFIGLALVCIPRFLAERLPLFCGPLVMKQWSNVQFKNDVSDTTFISVLRWSVSGNAHTVEDTIQTVNISHWAQQLRVTLAKRNNKHLRTESQWASESCALYIGWSRTPKGRAYLTVIHLRQKHIELSNMKQVSGGFAKLHTATIRFVMYVRLSVRMEQLASHYTDFHESWYLRISRTYIEQS